MERNKVESVRLETPFGAIESDSGNHSVDVITIGALIIVLYICKKIYFGR
jgi:hypothetical protein|tara:strand:+ start:2817 stop:2966 length:150 start_codon:yes stop_codon:yes gene_type:complete